VERVGGVPLPLAVLLVLAALQGVAWATFTAPLNGPDEPAHIAYAQHLAETGNGPNATSGTGVVSAEANLAGYGLGLVPMVGHAEARPTWSQIPRVERDLSQLPSTARTGGSGPNAVAQNPPLYYAYMAAVYRLSPSQSFFGRVYAMRVASVALCVATVALAWLIAAELFGPMWLRFLATAMVALQPKLVFMGSVVNPDTLLVLISTGFILAGLRLVLRGPSATSVLAVGALAGLGALTHGRGLFLLPAALFVVALSLVRARPPLRAVLRMVGGGSIGLVSCLAIAYLWTGAHSAAAFGGQVQSAATHPFNPREFVSYVWQFYLPRLESMAPSLSPPYGYRQMYIESFFGAFGHLEVTYPGPVTSLLQLGAGLGLAALFGTVCTRWDAVRRHWPIVAFAVATFGSLILLLHVSAYRALQGGTDPLITGRYLLACVALYGVAIAWVVRSLPQAVRLPIAAVLLGSTLLLDLSALGLVAARFYG
jgi:4-amino-4-deoxy-L-arabinose transferase-like glycosyltransferase